MYFYVCVCVWLREACGMCELFNQTRAKVNKTANKEPAPAATAAAGRRL